MNIFKVLASGRNKFSEESSSTILAWLMSPSMEHGLGSVFVRKFLTTISQGLPEQADRDAVVSLAEGIEPVLRTDGLNSTNDFQLLLEMSLKEDFIDVVLQIDKWWFAIENKIYDSSVNRKKLQLKQQYTGLRSYVNANYSSEHRIVSVFLLPSDKSEIKSTAREEVEAMKGCMDCHDIAVTRYWRSKAPQDEDSPSVSVAGILREILAEERDARIEPISDYSRHTLKALAVFIENDFRGYPYEREPVKGGQNEKTTAVLGLSEIRRRQACTDDERITLVGVSGGDAGLLRMSRTEVEKKCFQCSNNDDLKGSRNWLDVDRFLRIADWICGSTCPEIEWNGKFSALLLLKIATDYGDKVCIGLQGGKAALESMAYENLRTKSWSIGMGVPPNGNWISGSEFEKIVRGIISNVEQ